MSRLIFVMGGNIIRNFLADIRMRVFSGIVRVQVS